MVVFPGRLYHYVEPYTGNRLRITIAFNLKHPDFVVPYYEGMQEPDWWWTNFRGLMIIPEKVPEKLRALCILPAKLRARQVPRSFQLRAWMNHFKTALHHAAAEASARAEQSLGRVARSRAPNK
jgi:hypothetical protein